MMNSVKKDILRFDLSASEIAQRTDEIIAESTRTLDAVAKVNGTSQIIKMSCCCNQITTHTSL
jgi:hypothetical protein